MPKYIGYAEIRCGEHAYVKRPLLHRNTPRYLRKFQHTETMQIGNRTFQLVLHSDTPLSTIKHRFPDAWSTALMQALQNAFVTHDKYQEIAPCLN